MDGWIKLHRKIIDNPYYFSEAFTRSQAWVDLLLIANSKDGMFYKRGIRVEVNRGEVGYDIDTLSKRWKWSRGKVERFMNELENDNQIVRQKSRVTTLISIVNYQSYQSDSKTNGKSNSKTDGHQTDTNKKEKNIDTNVSIWRENFEVYLSDCKREHNRVYKDAEFIKKMQHYYPTSNIKKSIELSFDYWKSEEAWELKKSKKTTVINWTLTIKNSIDMKRVPLTKEELATA